MPYDFNSLLPADFEDFTRDLLGKAIGVRFEAFGPGPDGGIDGRHSTADGDIILQVKHYGGSSFSKLASAMRKERSVIDRLEPTRYILATSRHLSPNNKASLAAVIGPALCSEDDIFAQGDLNALLRVYPAVERTHLKLWLSSTVVLQTILNAIVNAGSHAFTASTRDEIASKVKVYAQNPSLAEARGILDQRHVLIISGPPGVGKTTLAEILAFAYLSEDWELIALRALEDGFAHIDDSRRQIFFFDDFLGTIALDQRALSTKDSELAHFMNRVRNSPNARFILTTRAYILNEAKLSSERLADHRVELSTYVLDLSAYTRAIKARILYNHLAIGGIQRDLVLALLDSGELPRIVDHPNYNPRVVEWMTDVLRIEDLKPNQYPAAFVEALDNPGRLWEKAFHNHITAAGRHLLIAIFFISGPFGCDIDELRTIFENLHARLCSDLGLARDPKDFESSLKHIEGGFVAIDDGSVDFINPSVRDFLAQYLADGTLLATIASTASSGLMTREVWTFAKKRLDPHRLSAVARSAVPSIIKLTQKSDDTDTELDSSDRITLLLDWWTCSGVADYVQAAISIARKPPKSFVPWRDGARLLTIVAELNNPELFEPGPESSALVEALETVVVELFEHGMWFDDLLTMSDLVEENDCYSSHVRTASHAAIVYEVGNANDIASNLTSESDLDEHADALRQLAPRADVPKLALQRALEAVEERVFEVRDSSAESSDPVLSVDERQDDEAFDDDALNNLFDSLR